MKNFHFLDSFDVFDVHDRILKAPKVCQENYPNKENRIVGANRTHFFSKENRFRLCVKFLDLTSSLLSPLPVVGPEFKERRVDFLGQSSFFAASQESLLPFIADQKENIYARLNEKLRNPCRTNRQKNSP